VTSTKQFIWCADKMCEARDASGSLLNQYFSYGQTISGNNYYYTRDHLGSVLELANGIGTIQVQYGYDPYGRVTELQGSLASDFQYAGYYFHAPSGLSLAVHRAYNATLGRWISKDPLEEDGGVNLYAYVENDPTKWTDPMGRVDTNRPTVPPGQEPIDIWGPGTIKTDPNGNSTYKGTPGQDGNNPIPQGEIKHYCWPKKPPYKSPFGPGTPV
jgi:RHS repeat-associated protein